MARKASGKNGSVPVEAAPPPPTQPNRLASFPKPQRVQGTSEYLSGGMAGAGYVNTVHALTARFDDATEEFGPQVYEAMLKDSAVNSAFLTLKQGILDKDFEFTPALAADPEEYDSLSPEQQADIGRAQEIRDYCCRVLDGMQRPLFDVCFELLDGMAFGCKLGEKIYKIAESGPDAGQIVLDQIKVKPRHVWEFAVDSRLNVIGILGVIPAVPTSTYPANVLLSGFPLGGAPFLPKEKFCLFSWLPRNCDPRGTSVLRPAYAPWNYKIRTFPQYSDFLERMAAGFFVGQYAEGGINQAPIDAEGHVIADAEQVDAATALLQALVAARNGTALVVPPGTVVDYKYPPLGGESFVQSLNMFNREIVYAILQTTRATLEAEYGSKADSETSQEEKGLVVRVGKRVLCNMVREEILKDLVRFRYGDDAAERLTPKPVLGETEHHQFGVEATAIAALQKSGYLDPSQLPGIDSRLGLPKRSSQEIDKRANPEPAPVPAAPAAVPPAAAA